MCVVLWDILCVCLWMWMKCLLRCSVWLWMLKILLDVVLLLLIFVCLRSGKRGVSWCGRRFVWRCSTKRWAKSRWICILWVRLEMSFWICWVEFCWCVMMVWSEVRLCGEGLWRLGIFSVRLFKAVSRRILRNFCLWLWISVFGSWWINLVRICFSLCWGCLWIWIIFLRVNVDFKWWFSRRERSDATCFTSMFKVVWMLSC